MNPRPNKNHQITIREQAEARRAAIRACGQCDPLGWVIINGRAHRCRHGEDSAE